MKPNEVNVVEMYYAITDMVDLFKDYAILTYCSELNKFMRRFRIIFNIRMHTIGDQELDATELVSCNKLIISKQLHISSESWVFNLGKNNV